MHFCMFITLKKIVDMNSENKDKMVWGDFCSGWSIPKLCSIGLDTQKLIVVGNKKIT